MTAPQYRSAARAWLAEDPDAETRAELEQLLHRADRDDPEALAELADRFGTRLAFGTAGLRGRLGAGSNRMNRVLVAQAAAGLARFLTARTPERTPSVVVGYDARRNSEVFARDSAEIFAGAGLRAMLMPRMLPTPVLAFAVRELDADAGVMVTASHNPPDDNGYKVYLGGEDRGAQIVPPVDAEIAAQIEQIAAHTRISLLPHSTGYQLAPERVIQAYHHHTAVAAPAPRSGSISAGARPLTWVYSAMHGVGWQTVAEVVRAAGYPEPILVDAQIEPDARFPTVVFPNPEEPGAMDMSFATATEAGADLVIANDPDADRLAVAVPDANGSWQSLTGNEVGLLLGWRAARRNTTRPVPDATLACSLVSSPGLAAIAERFGINVAVTLTGFKWISRAPNLIYGFEEALGYLVNPETVRDKDGISSAVAVLELATQAHAAGRTLRDLIGDFESQFGVFRSAQVSTRAAASDIAELMASFRAQPPSRLAGRAITGIDDLLTGVDDLPTGDVLRWWTEDGSRVIVRPSGTEPKIKVYLDVRGESATQAEDRLHTLSQAIRDLLP